MIRIVCVDIAGADEEVYRKLNETASPQRKARADGYRVQEDALRCLTADALLRYALGADTCCVVQEKGGKPQIPEHPEFHFNLSHAGRWVVLAWGDSELGVDVEEIRRDVNLTGLAARYFTLEEQAYIQAGDPPSRFFEIWTRKESYLKYLGTGLTKPLSGFSVLDGETGMQFWQKELPGNYWLCLCSDEREISMELLEVSRLTQLGLTEVNRKHII